MLLCNTQRHLEISFSDISRREDGHRPHVKLVPRKVRSVPPDPQRTEQLQRTTFTFVY